MAAALGVLVSCGSVKSGEEVVAASRDSKVVVAYVTSWSEVMPDPQYMTHINYAFGHVNESFNGVKIDNEERLRQIVDLRKQKPELKVLLSIGGWGSGRFSEMAANDEYRRAFAADCDRVVEGSLWMALTSIGNIPPALWQIYPRHRTIRRILHF